MLLNKPLMLEPRSFELLSLYKEKQPIFKNFKHSIKNNVGKGKTVVIPIHGILT
ncbi:S49 family peptidase, partial [Wolbachia endosymbiont of Pentalonia nigronervosa]|nr:S49 family peptidase [Wolbachia endosymbiont of Pentalonia nigronervosa]